MTYSALLLAVSSAAPATVSWSPKVGLVMIICNILAIAIGKYTIYRPYEKPALPMPQMFGDLSLGALLGTTSFGHILGVGAILGLAYVGAL